MDAISFELSTMIDPPGGSIDSISDLSIPSILEIFSAAVDLFSFPGFMITYFSDSVFVSAGIGSGTAYWVEPSQVSKTPESGEFVSKGSWIVRGKRNYVLNLPLQLKISLIDYKGNTLPMISPAETKTESEKYVIIKPGNEKRSTAAEKISKMLGIDRSEIESILPPGGSIIVESSKEIASTTS